MTPFTLLKAPIKDVTKLNDLRRELNLERKALESGEITEELFKKRKKVNRTKMATVGLPLATASLMILMFGSTECYEAFKSGVPATDFIGNNMDLISELASKSFEKNPLEETSLINELSNSNFDLVKDYVSYIAGGIKGFVSGLAEHYLNSAYLLTTAAAYGVATGAVKALGFVSGMTKDIEKHRLYSYEDTKLNILRKHFHDPVFDNLNNEELFSMSLSFNEILHANSRKKKKVLRKGMSLLDNMDNMFKIGRKALNKSNNNKSHLMENVFSFLEKDIVKEDLNSSLNKYGITRDEFKAVADKDGALTEDHKNDYLYGLNKRAILAAYDRKLKDDMILSFSIRLESYVRKEVDMNDEDMDKDLDKFKKYIQYYSKENKILKREKLPEDLRVIDKMLKLMGTKKDHDRQEINRYPENSNYIDFLKKHASHLVEDRGDKKVFLNNYSFVSYYEAERERLAKLDVVNVRLKENLDSMYRNSETRNRSDFNKKQEKILKLQEDAMDLNDIFYNQDSLIAENKTEKVEDIFKPEVEKVSTVYNDETVGYEVAVRNFLTERENLSLLGGDACKEKGLDLLNAERAVSIDTKLSTSDEKVSRREFKRNKKRFKG